MYISIPETLGFVFGLLHLVICTVLEYPTLKYALYMIVFCIFLIILVSTIIYTIIKCAQDQRGSDGIVYIFIFLPIFYVGRFMISYLGTIYFLQETKLVLQSF